MLSAPESTKLKQKDKLGIQRKKHVEE